MNIYAIGDLHLPGGQDKPMHIFGAEWKNHQEKIEHAWRSRVGVDDIVLVPGDISWALKLSDAADDLAWLGRLPGKIILSRGNHDYWWQTISRVRAALAPDLYAVQNDAIHISHKWAVCATRGWELPGSDDYTQHDEQIYARELVRLKLSLDDAVKKGLHPAIVMLHYPPGYAYLRQTDVTELLQSYDVKLCVYGHLHGAAGHGKALKGMHKGVMYQLVSADFIDFAPRLVATVEEDNIILH